MSPISHIVTAHSNADMLGGHFDRADLLMNTVLRRVGGFLILTSGVLLSACGGGSNGGGGTIVQPPPPPPPPASFELTQVYDNIALVQPVGLYQAPGDNSRWFAVEQAGQIWVFDNDPAVNAQTSFLDVTALVSSGGEAGLLGMAFHPDFGNANFDVFVSYTRAGAPLESVISRFTSNDGGLTLDGATESIILTIAQDAANHNGGQIGFGQDGFLYAGWGDGGGAGDPLERGQQTSSLLGSFTRIDIDSAAPYAIPAANPFAGNTECMTGSGVDPCPEIFAWGLRNPWRWSFDSQTGIIWAGDVGQGDWEEVDRIELSMNYGWNDREGAHCFDPASGCDTNNVDPITEYSHALGASITGGYVYRGSAAPSLAGEYVFGDFISGRIWTIPATSGIGTAPNEILTTTYSISAFAEDNDGEIYLIDYAAGNLYQLSEQ